MGRFPKVESVPVRAVAHLGTAGVRKTRYVSTEQRVARPGPGTQIRASVLRCQYCAAASTALSVLGLKAAIQTSVPHQSVQTPAVL
eukprot:1490769-Rhodomonas_salina.1